MDGTPRWTTWHSAGLVGLLVTLGAVGLGLAPTDRLAAWGASMLLMALGLVLIGRGVNGRWCGVLIDQRNRMSLARLQALAWTVVVLAGFEVAALANVAADRDDPLQIAVPEEVWLLLGIGTTSMVAAPLIHTVKASRAATAEESDRALARLAENRGGAGRDRFAVRGQLVVNLAPTDALWAELFTGEEVGNVSEVDLGKVQMFYVSLVLLLTYAAALGHLLRAGGPIRTLPDVDPGLVALLGISNAGYLTYKALPHSRGP